MTYTVYDNDGEILVTDLSLSEAVQEILTYDSQEYKIQPSEGKYGGYDLWIRKQCANKPWTQAVIWSLERELEKATCEIYSKVIDAQWPGPYAELIEKRDD